MMRIYSDFDGTIAVHDIGNQLFRRYVGPKAVEIVSHYLNGTSTARECLTAECEAVGPISEEELDAFVRQFDLDPSFGVFVEFCKHREIPLVVLSDGLDFYVERLLKKHGHGDLAFYANHLEFVREGGRTRMVPSFPHSDAECLLCGNCKRNHLLTLSGDDDIIVYIGDGISDRCPVRFADVVFAKGSLRGYCQEQNITYHEFRDFTDVMQRLELLLQKKRIKKRREAEMARREVFSQG